MRQFVRAIGDSHKQQRLLRLADLRASSQYDNEAFATHLKEITG